MSSLRSVYLLITTLFLAVGSSAAPKVKAVDEADARRILISHAGVEYQADLYLPFTLDTRKTAIVLFHECWGKGELEARHARMLAKQGHMVLVADLFGKGASTKSFEKAMDLVEKAEGETLRPLYVLAGKSVEVLRAETGLAKDTPVAGIGFGFGAGILLNALKTGTIKNLSAAVLFYGGVEKIEKIDAKATKTPLLYLRPENDAYTMEEVMTAFSTELKESGWSLELQTLKGASHGFVQEGIESYGLDEGETFLMYDAVAARRAWELALGFLARGG